MLEKREYDEQNSAQFATRRQFLTTALAAASVALVTPFDTGRGQVFLPLSELGRVSSDVLTEAELRSAGIIINQSPGTKLYLRRRALQLPLFQDVLSKKIQGVTISLLDRESLSWSAGNSLPTDARAILQHYYRDPSTYSEYQWDSERTTFDIYIHNLQIYRETLNKDLAVNIRDKEKVRRTIETVESAIEKFKNDRELLGDRKKAIEHFSENSDAIGQFFREENKVYIYICVGGKLLPNPSDSFPSPDWFDIDYDEVMTLSQGYTNIGFTLRHEFSHYNPDYDPKDRSTRKVNPEETADRLALETIKSAWQTYQKNGDSSEYAFVFVNSNGVTIAQNLQHYHQRAA